MSPDQPDDAPSDAPQLWRQERLWPVIYNLVAVTLIAGMLWVNALDVRTNGVRVFYGLMGVWLVVSFFVRRFRLWQLARIAHGQPSTRGRLDGGLGGLEFCLSVVMLLLAAEAVARALPPLSNSSTNYPGANFVWPDRYARRNSFGLNDKYIGPQTGRPRILVLGDSYVEGAGVARHERFCSVLQSTLQKTRPEAHVIAGGQCGWNTQDEARFLNRHGAEIEPDVVIVAYVLNDVEGQKHLSAQPSRLEIWLQTRLHSYLCYRLFRMRRGAMSEYWKLVQQRHQPDSPSWLAVASSLKSIEAWCRQRKIPCELVVLPIFTRDADAGREVMEQVASRAKALGFHSYQTLDDFDGRWIDFAVSPYDAHPNASGHARIAKRIEAELKASEALTATK
ncbi:MAG: GDSL-like Lipase/Acylhydrolase [Planctomycetaceae bacterium]|nr:GDSL-like Lipase/Acylhydrolase [Planctomycetaceae bacterium]